MARKKTVRWHHCNVLYPGRQTRQLWQFYAGGGKVSLGRTEAKLPTERFSERLISKDWQAVFQPRLNVAWLPADQVFLRVIQVPRAADAGESQSMLELQLEKVSPLPVTQIVWSYELIDQPMGDMQTAIIIIAERRMVEEFLGRLEGEGFLADRLELPALDQLRATTIEGDGAQIYPGLGSDGGSCMVAWWYAGILWNLSLFQMPPAENRAESLRAQMAQMMWSGELEGWLVSTPKFYVIADAETATAWQLTEPEFKFVPPLSAVELAARTARRAAVTNGAPLNLLPPDYAARYRQKFVDRLWMRLLGACVMLYILGVGIYFLLVQVQEYRFNNLQKQVVAAGVIYTNTIQIKERVAVLQTQVDLQWAALECYKVIADLMPTDLTMESLNFNGGTKLTLSGTGASTEDRNKVLDFMDGLRQVTSKEQLLFRSMDGPRLGNVAPGQAAISWSFSADLRRADQP